MNGNQLIGKIRQWLSSTTTSEVHDALVDMVVDSMEEPLLANLPPGFDLSMLPEEMQEEFLNNIKSQILISLRSIINANRNNSDIHQIVMRKHFSDEEQEKSKEAIEKYAEVYTQEVEDFYQSIQNGNLRSYFYN